MLPTDLSDGITLAIDTANRSLFFMPWNTFLAVIPFVLSLWLFRGKGSGVRRLTWWIGLAVFVAFLPNAPYVLTDIIHLVRLIREGAPLWIIVFVLVPQYLIFMLVGVEAYVGSLVNLGHYLRQQGQQRWVLPAEHVLHALCAIGIYLGRFPRFNSWDIVTGPHRVAMYLVKALLTPRIFAVMLLTFVVIAAVYWPMKQITLALMLYWKPSKSRREALPDR
ncbi:MAG: DUF1361 domain-containing protein [Cyanobacteria bacterium J06598_1]